MTSNLMLDAISRNEHFTKCWMAGPECREAEFLVFFTSPRPCDRLLGHQRQRQRQRERDRRREERREGGGRETERGERERGGGQKARAQSERPGVLPGRANARN